jgi:hypothetical protein
MKYIPDLKTLRQAGHRRARRAVDLIDFLKMDSVGRAQLLDELQVPAIKRLGLLSLMGSSEQVIIATVSPAALGAAAATYIGPLIGLPEQPLVLGVHFCPTVTGANAAVTLTFAMRRTDTPANIATQSFLTATADTNPRGPFIVGVVPFGIPAANGIDVQGTASAGAGTLTASATSPLILAAVGFN